MKITLLNKIVLGGAGSALLGLSALSAAGTPAVLAANVAGTNQPQAPQPTKHRDHKDARGDRREIARAVFEAEADALGVKPEELRDDLRKGMTAEQIAKSKNLTKEQVADRLVTALRPRLDKLVDQHKVTRQQADHVLNRIQSGRVPFWEGRHHKAGKPKAQ